jgi:predicted ATPase/DNA-binding winged helix-turn-helix (wHTH) protein
LQPSRYRCGDFQVDLVNRCFTHGGREVPLEPRVFAVIVQLLGRPHTLVARHELLDAIWGHRYVTPSTLNRTIGLARRAFCDDVDDPRYIQTVHGSGYRYVGPLDVEPVDGGALVARFAPPSTARLPARIERLIGREAELDLLVALLREGRAVTVLGTGGMGKTQCALEAARRVSGEFEDGVWFFDLAPCKDAEEWLRALGSALALPASAADVQLGKIGAFLRDRHALLVLDNCDRVAAQVGELVVALLRSTAAIRVLATSQVPLNFAGEQLMRVPPLALPVRTPSGTIDVDAVVKSASSEMLVARIRTLQPDFVLTPDNAATIGEICHRLDGMPLALELAATRFTLLSPQQVLERLVSRFRFLGSDTAGRDVRHRSLLTLLDWSYSMLSALEQRLLNWCTTFVHSWTMDATIALAATLGHDAQTAVDLLAGLANRSLVAVVAGSVPPRYRLLETVRDYATDQLVASGERAQAQAAHIQVVERMCRAAHEDFLHGRMREMIAKLMDEHGNISTALDTSLATPDGHVTAMSILGSLALYSKAHGEYQTIARWCRKVFAGSGSLEIPERARALLTWGLMQVHLNASDEWYETALPDAIRIAAAHGDWWTEAYGHGYLAMGLANWGQPQLARVHADALEKLLSDHGGGAELVGLAALARAWIHLTLGEPGAALASLRSVRRLGVDVHQDHFVEIYVALAQFETRDFAGAALQWLGAMDLSLAVGNVRGLAGSIEGCGYLACQQGDWVQAARLLAAAEGIRERTGIPLFRFWLAHRQRALEALQSNLPPADHAEALRAGAAQRQEDAANEARAVLQRLAVCDAAAFAQTTANRPAGS